MSERSWRGRIGSLQVCLSCPSARRSSPGNSVLAVADMESVEVSLWLLPGCSTRVVVPRSPPYWRCWRGPDLSLGQMMDLSTSWSFTRD